MKRCSGKSVSVTIAKPLLYCLVLAWFTGAAAWAQTAGEQTLDRVVAFVADRVITQRELLIAVAQVRRMLERQNRPPPEQDVLVAEVMQNLIARKLQLHEAERSNVVIDDQRLEQAVAKIAESNDLTLAQMVKSMEERGESYQAFRAKVREDLAIREVRQREVIDKINATDAEIREQLRGRNKAALFRYSHLRIPFGTDEDARDAAAKRLAKIKKQMREGRPIEELTEELAGPEAAGAEAGFKRTGWRKLAQMPAAVAGHIADMEVGETTPIIQTPGHLHLIRLDGKRREGEPQLMQKQYMARHILMRTNIMDTDEVVRKKLHKIKRRILRGADFGRAAKRYSQDPGSNFKGGEMGWIAPQDMVQAFAEKVITSPPGEITGPFRSQFGWHLLQVQDTREVDISRQKERADAVAKIRGQKAEEEIRSWILRLREKYYVDIVL